MADLSWQDVDRGIAAFEEAVTVYSPASPDSEAESTCMLSRQATNGLLTQWLITRVAPDELTRRMAASLKAFRAKLEEVANPSSYVIKYIESVNRRIRVLSAIVENDIQRLRHLLASDVDPQAMTGEVEK